MGTGYTYTCGCRDPQPLMIGTDRQTAKICSDTWAAMQAGKGACLIFDIWSDSKGGSWRAASGRYATAVAFPQKRNPTVSAMKETSFVCKDKRGFFCIWAKKANNRQNTGKSDSGLITRLLRSPFLCVQGRKSPKRLVQACLLIVREEALVNMLLVW